MSEEQGESVETPDDESGDGTDDASARPDDERAEESVDLEELQDLVEAHETETVAREIAGLREQVLELDRKLEAERAEREDLESRLKHKQAEFQNYKKRQSRLREQERARATEDLVERLLEVRDNLRRALEQDDDAEIREGVEATLRQLDEVFRGENVEPIEPEPGAEVDPQRHEVLLKVDGDRPAGTVEEVHSPGYEMADKVLRAARVTVADEGGEDEAGAADADDAGEPGPEAAGDGVADAAATESGAQGSGGSGSNGGDPSPSTDGDDADRGSDDDADGDGNAPDENR